MDSRWPAVMRFECKAWVAVDARAETFARLLVTRDDEPGAAPQKVELAADWRAHAPVSLDIGASVAPR
ncbi:hypothetical protein Ahu01nite_020720 [Winogradskya humida]|uniref:Uncharacterized protein n=1 Tax=Winogradskya humida TaxID=113566 RepID=A0ABQ3ZK59_9ACTN|nr:hypothetical protein Ahu01nite_020720 [Actinoplanes humidus]